MKIVSSKQKLKKPQVHGKRKKTSLYSLEKKLNTNCLMEEIKDIWHQVIVTKVPDDNETSDDYDFTMKHQSYNDNYGVKLLNVFPVCHYLGKADEPS